MVIFPLAPDQTIAQMWSNGARGEAYRQTGTTQNTIASDVVPPGTDCRQLKYHKVLLNQDEKTDNAVNLERFCTQHQYCKGGCSI